MLCAVKHERGKDCDATNEESAIDSVIPPYGRFTADEFLHMNGLPKRSELIDGSIVFSVLFGSPEDGWDSFLGELLRMELARHTVINELGAERQIVIRLDDRQAPDLGVVVVTAEGFDETCAEASNAYRPENVVLVIETVSPDTEIRNLDAKPRRYAAAGVRHFSRAQREGRNAVVHVYERDLESGSYALTGIHHDRLTLSVPFDLDIDLTAVGEPPR